MADVKPELKYWDLGSTTNVTICKPWETISYKDTDYMEYRCDPNKRLKTSFGLMISAIIFGAVLIILGMLGLFNVFETSDFGDAILMGFLIAGLFIVIVIAAIVSSVRSFHEHAMVRSRVYAETVRTARSVANLAPAAAQRLDYTVGGVQRVIRKGIERISPAVVAPQQPYYGGLYE